MNELQKVEFDIFKEFIRICEELNLTYYLVCGSALGAAKYQGFIPWDDDLDVALPRDDYEVFCQEASKMLPKHLFLQNYHTDKYYPLFMSKIRNSNTTLIEGIHSEINMNHGIYIDVFPLDGYPKNSDEALILEKEKVLFSRRRLVRCKYNRFSKQNIFHIKAIGVYILYILFGYCKNTDVVIERFDKIASAYNCDNSQIWCNHGNWQGKLEYADKTQYGKGTFTYFEGLKVRIPENYDAYLTQKYGEWRFDLPKEQQISHHNYELCDTTKPYTEYVDVISEHRIKLKNKK